MQPGSQATRCLAHLVCPENEIRAAPIRIVGTPGGPSGLVLPLEWLVHRDYLAQASCYHGVRMFHGMCVVIYNGLLGAPLQS